ncbi:MAG: hypothetical protein QXU64_05675 [Thermofilaceae archaeon]
MQRGLSWSAYGHYAYPRLRTARVLLDNLGGTIPLTRQLLAEPTTSVRAVVRYPRKVMLEDGTVVDQSTLPPVLVGNVSERFCTLAPGDELETCASDLSTVYATVPPGVVVYLELVWEEVPP